MKYSNDFIFNCANDLICNFTGLNVYIPAKANFFLQKNIQIFTNAAQEINKSRLEIAKHYGVLDENRQEYDIPEENIEKANQELSELFSIEQDLDIKTFSIDALGNTEFTPAQMQAIMFMIED